MHRLVRATGMKCSAAPPCVPSLKGIAVIPRSTKPEHIREKFALFDFTLTPDEMAQLSALDRKEPLIGKPETPELVEFSLTW